MFTVGPPGILRCLQRGIVLPVQGDKDVGEIHAADDQSEYRVEDVLHQTVDDSGERGADDDADREVDDIAAQNEPLELVDPTRRLWQTDVVLHRGLLS
jgi:hypothetical protein